ncbi:Neural cell adhesion molecule 1-A, partial [Orchesella cincta]
VLITSVECFSPLWDSVKTQVFQEYEVLEARGQISVVRIRLKNIKDHELIVGGNVKPNSRLILTCTAWYPSEWVYSGDADPTYHSNTTIENLSLNGQVLPVDEMNGAKRYVATVVIGPRGVKQSDTGRYNCMTASPETGMRYKTLSAYFHLFVPGKTLFTRKRGGTILYDLRKSPARIPCGVTNPRVAVSLQKLSNGNLINVDNETMLYHPISGFYPRQDIPGTYVCTAAFNKAFELLHFTLVPKAAASGMCQS